VFQFAATGWIAGDASRNGVLVWRAPGVDEVQFELVDRAGRTLSVITQPDAFTNFDLSPDGTRIVTTRRRPGDAASALFLIDLSRNLTTPISEPAGGSAISDPTWSPDGRQIAYRRGDHLVVRNAFGGDERVLTDWPAYPDSWTRDGKYLTVGRPRYSDYELWAFRMVRARRCRWWKVSRWPTSLDSRPTRNGSHSTARYRIRPRSSSFAFPQPENAGSSRRAAACSLAGAAMAASSSTSGPMAG
jgi:dipeptidyl aminopeptidase/acylaminoacyl peptidase